MKAFTARIRTGGVHVLPLNFNHLYYFYVVSKHGSFSDAARELAVSQSAVSVQMKQFEGSLGTTLFDRRKSGVELTGPGEIVYEYAEEIFQNVDRLRDELQSAGRLIGPTAEDWNEAWDAFRRDDHGGAGIVDHISFVVMRRLGIQHAFSNDHHFHAAGFKTLF